MPRGARTLGLIAVASALAMQAGCASPSPSCDLLCPVARPAFEACLDEWGMTYGDAVGYADADDYDSWCDTWVMEQRLLADTTDDPDGAHAALDDRCADRIDRLEAGACLDYWSLWD